jgi:DNA mismatch repair protein MSH2
MFKSMVEQVVDLEGIEKGEYFVQSSFDDNLKEYRKQMNDIEAKCHSQLSRI